MGEINVVLVDLPAAARGCVLPEADGSYTIYVNGIYNIEQQREIYCHEMTHILDGHTHQHQRPVAEIEHEAQSRSKLVARIHEAEERGLPLEMAIFRGHFFEGESPPFFCDDGGQPFAEEAPPCPSPPPSSCSPSAEDTLPKDAVLAASPLAKYASSAEESQPFPQPFRGATATAATTNVTTNANGEKIQNFVLGAGAKPAGGPAENEAECQEAEDENDDRLDALFADLQAIEDDWRIQLENEYHQKQQYQDFSLAIKPLVWPAN